MKEIISRNEGLHRHTNESSYKERTDDRSTNIEKVKHGGERWEERRRGGGGADTGDIRSSMRLPLTLPMIAVSHVQRHAK